MGAGMGVEDTVYKRLRWRSRRGMAELDLFLMPFIEETYLELTPPQQQTYEELLEHDDPELMSWFNHQCSPDDPDMAELVERICRGVERR